MKIDLNKILAREYGFLDAKHKMGYDPRPFGYEFFYDGGYWEQGNGNLNANNSVLGTSYQNKINWGWY